MDLAAYLFSYAREIKSVIDDKESEIQYIEKQRTVRNFDKFNYDEDSGSLSYSWSTEIEKEQIPDLNSIENILDENLKSDIGEKCLKELEEGFPETGRDPELLLRTFRHEIARASIEDIEDKEIAEKVDIFLSELRNSDIDWQVKIWIDGLTTGGEFQIGDNMTIRPPQEDDLKNIRQHSPRNPKHLKAPDSIIEKRIRTNNQRAIQDWLQTLVSTLRLFKVCSAEKRRVNYDNEGIIPGISGMQSNLDSLRTHKYKVQITEENSTVLSEFLEKSMTKINERVLSKEDEDYFTISFERYERALSKSDSSEERLLSSIMSLESLFLREKEMNELSERLSQRIGILMSLLGKNPNEVYNQVKRAYRIRSSYVHGSKIENSEEANKLERDVLDYNRRAILLFIQVRDEMKKENFISKLDNALLNKDAREQLKDELEEMNDLKQIEFA
jgi:hypothetical protein